MILDITGVIQVEGDTAPGVPTDPRMTISIPFGTSLTLRVHVVNSDGSTVTPLVVNGLYFTVKKSPMDSQGIFPTKKGPAAAAPFCDFTLGTADYKNMTPGRYVYDIWYKDGAGNKNPVVPLSPLELEWASTTF